jgi:hypothetical protein
MEGINTPDLLQKEGGVKWTWQIFISNPQSEFAEDFLNFFSTGGTG